MISIIIPVYNVKNYLDKCIQSIASSCYSDLEIILVDDGSTDGSGQICDEWEKKDSRIKVLHQQNSGVSTARNNGLKACTGDYITFADADDYVSEDLYKTLLDEIIRTNSDISVCGYYIDDLKTSEKRTVTEAAGIYDTAEAIKKYISSSSWQLTVWNKLFKRRLIFDSDNNMILYPTDLTIGEDAVWLLNVTLNAQKIAFVSFAGYNYIVNRNDSAVSKSKGKNKIKGCCSRFEASKRGYELLCENKIDSYALMYRRCVFSARDIACEYYISHDKSGYGWIDTLGSCIKKYKKMVGKSGDRMFIIKNSLLYHSMKIHMPTFFVKLIEKI